MTIGHPDARDVASTHPTGAAWEIRGVGGARSFNGALPVSGLATFTVGVSDPALHFPRTSAGDLDDSSGYESAVVEIRFEAPSGADGSEHTLRIRTREGSGPSPDFLIESATGRALGIPRRRRDSRGHAPLPPGPVAGFVELDVALPPGFVGAGEQWLRLSAAPRSLPDRRRDRRSPGSWFGNTWHWDAVELRPTAGTEPDVEARSLPLYRAGRHGDLATVEVVLRHTVPADLADLTIVVAGSLVDLAQARLDRADVGDVRITASVPEFTGDVEVEVGLRGRSWRRTIRAARKWTVHVIPHVHLDLGYTDLQAKITSIHTANVDRARAIRARVPGYRYTLDGSYIAHAYEQTRTPGAVDAFHDEVEQGALGLNAFWSTPLTGVCSREELTRGLYFAAGAQRAGWLTRASANLTDVPTYTGALPAILADAGITRFFGIANHMRGGNADSDVLHLLSPVQWEGPAGRRVTTFFADGYTQLRTVFADQPQVTGVAVGLSRFLERYERDDYPHVDLPLYGTHADNEDLGSGYADVVSEWEAEYAWPRLRFSTIDDYFDAIDASGAPLPVVRGDGGSYWEDGVGTAPQLHAAHRRVQAALPGIEAASALVAGSTPHLRPDLAALDESWRGVLVGGEHTFTASYGTDAPDAHGVLEQLRWKSRLVDRSEALVADLGQRAIADLGDLIDLDAVPAFLVVNPTARLRSDSIEIEVPAGHRLRAADGSHPRSVRVAAPVDGRERQRIDLPPVAGFGFHALDFVRAEVPVVERVPLPQSGSVPFGPWEVVLAAGEVVAIRDASGADLFDDASRFRPFDVVVVDGGGTREGRGREHERTSLWDYDPTLPLPELTQRVATRGSAQAEFREGAVAVVSWTVEVAGVIVGVAELSRAGSELELAVRLEKEPEVGKQSVYVVFPFRAAGRVEFDRQQGWFNPEDALPGAALEWFAHGNVVRVEDDAAGGVAWASRDAALVTFDEPVRGTWPTSLERSGGTLLSWITNNYWFTNTPASQHGSLDVAYRFGRSRGRVDDLAMAKDLREPLLTGIVTVADRRDPWPRPLPRVGRLWDAAVPANVDVQVFPARFHAESLLVRFQEVAGSGATFETPVPAGVVEIVPCSDVEAVEAGSPIHPDGGPLRVDLRPDEVRSYLMRLERRP